MPGIARVGVDNAGGGVIVGPGAPTVLAEGFIVSCASGATPETGDVVTTHGEPPHNVALIQSGSATVIAMGRPVAMAAFSIATCGHPVGPGAVTVQVGI